ncbi:MAG: cyclopropane-fatty-acyl-phospholipid synthase family protein [Rhodospirillales bacterium]
MPPGTAPLLRYLARKTLAGTVTVRLPDGSAERVTGPQPGPIAEVTIHRPRVLRRLLLGGANGFAESYLDGDFDTPDLTALLLFGAANQAAWGDLLRGRWPLRLAAQLKHRLRPNSKPGSKRNIAAHYDLGNRFYGLWLDPSLTYSSAVFSDQDQALEAAQDNKYRLICERAGIRQGDSVLEIGCGWGGFALHAARERQARVTAVTISDAQFEAAAQRIQDAGLSDRVTLLKSDYRDLEGRYDAIVSIEMIEAVGERYWPTYFAKLRNLSLPGGKVALQAITIDEHHFEHYRRSADFIQRHIFPGGMLPSTKRIRQEAQAAGLSVAEEGGYGADYAQTLALWRQRFEAAWQDIAALGFDQRFRRLWRYYLAYCEAGFRAQRIDLRQIILAAER